MADKKGKEVIIINRRSGKALQPETTENGAAVLQTEITGAPEQIWYTEKTDGGTRLIHKASGKALDLIYGGTGSGTGVHIWEKTDAPGQLWKITGGVSRKVTNPAAAKVLDIRDMSEQDGAPAQIWDDVGGENQRWRFTAPAVRT